MQGRTIVVGGGVMGAAIAWSAARRADPIEAPVVLYEQTRLAAGSSGRSGAILRQFYSDAELVRVARDSLRAYAGFQATTGRDIAFQRMGVLSIGGPGAPGTVELVERTARLLRAHGVDARLVDAQAMRELVPGLAVDDAAVGCYEPDGAGVDPVRTVEAFAALARELGAITRIGERVREIVVEHGRVRGVRKDHEFVEAARVVVAAGPWSRPLLAAAGIELPLTVVRPEQHFLALPRVPETPSPASHDVVADSVLDRFGVAARKLPSPAHPVILDVERGFYTRCEGHAQRTRVGRMDYTRDEPVPDPDALDETVSDAFRAWARASLEARLPAYAREADAGSLVGLYTLTPDAQAAIGAWPALEGLFIVTGFSGHGFKLAPSIGAGVAQMLAGEPVTAFDPAFFDPARFARRGAGRESRAFGL
ncbi:MAG: FAD-dependent oxidoreductase [Planctomycetes bacterium]|nr:FAD-dependent oxidoreductase [Planctomycetota bacterium]